jgi:hypothetical protein
MICDQTRPASLVRSTNTTSIVTVEVLWDILISIHVRMSRLKIAYLIEPNVVAEVRVVVELNVAAICSTLTLKIAAKDVNDAMLDLLGNVRKVHVVAAASRTLYLNLVAIVLIESLK